MDDALLGTIGGCIGVSIVVAGGAWATYRAIKSRRSVAARRFAMRAAAVMWWVLGLAGLTVLLAVFDPLPRWVYWTVMVYMLAGLMPAIRFFGTRRVSSEAPGGVGGVRP